MQDLSFYQARFLEYLETFATNRKPETLYKPVNYILLLGGKRLRPILTLITTEAFGGSYKKALNAALAIEVFHNFSLVHDDIMDQAPLRRGNPTVHEKWTINTGILSGDAMLILAYQLFENYDTGIFKELATLFSKTALQVCEGQQYDIDFEKQDVVTIPQYLKMIEYKTAVLLGAAMQMGAIVAEASLETQNNIYDFGKNLGIAFQMQDDYLDVFGNPESFGKQVGGDIIENKKTFLYLKTMQLSSEKTRQELQTLFKTSSKNPSEKITHVKQLFISSGAADATEIEIKNYTNAAFNVLKRLDISEDKKAILKKLGEQLIKRTI